MSKLLQTTLDLLKRSGLSVERVSKDTGLGKRWLYRLIDGDFKDPGVSKIEKLHCYLTSSDDEDAA